MSIATQLAAANTQLMATLTDTVTHQARVETPDGAGGETVTFGAPTTLPARVHRRSDTPGDPAARDGSLNVLTVVVPVEAAVAAGDRLTWGGQLLHVVTVSESSWAIGQYLEVVVP